MKSIHDVLVNINPTTVTEDDVPVRSVLEETPHRALAFLEALSTQPAIRATLAGAGYIQADHAEGWNLFFVVTGYGADLQGVTAATAATQAIDQIDTWEASGFARA